MLQLVLCCFQGLLLVVDWCISMEHSGCQATDGPVAVVEAEVAFQSTDVAQVATHQENLALPLPECCSHPW